MAGRWTNTLTHKDVTPEAVFLNRRQLIAGAAAAGVAGTIASPAMAEELVPNSFEDITNYCNFYEFGTGKDDPARYAGALTTQPWSIEIDGMVDNPGTYSFEQVKIGRAHV